MGSNKVNMRKKYKNLKLNYSMRQERDCKVSMLTIVKKIQMDNSIMTKKHMMKRKISQKTLIFSRKCLQQMSRYLLKPDISGQFKKKQIHFKNGVILSSQKIRTFVQFHQKVPLKILTLVKNEVLKKDISGPRPILQHKRVHNVKKK